MKLNKYYGKKVKILTDLGTEFFGYVSDYLYPEDNDSGKESIIIDTEDGSCVEFYENDISKISVLKNKKE